MYQQQNNEDAQYEKWGVDPPSRDVHGSEQDIADTLAKPVRHGRWKQSGNVISCNLCPLSHSHTIPVDYLLEGDDANGLPKMRKLM